MSAAGPGVGWNKGGWYRVSYSQQPPSAMEPNDSAAGSGGASTAAGSPESSFAPPPHFGGESVAAWSAALLLEPSALPALGGAPPGEALAVLLRVPLAAQSESLEAAAAGDLGAADDLHMAMLGTGA